MKRDEPERDLFPDDPNDPIPRVGVIDVYSELDNGDLLCGLIIAKPIPPNKKFLERLVRKVENYIRELGGSAQSHNVRVDFIVHPRTDPVALHVIEKCGAWLQQHLIQFTITIRDPNDYPSPTKKIN